MNTQETINKITEYLSVGGLFNSESLEHDKVRDLLMECRQTLASAQWRPIETAPKDGTQVLGWADEVLIIHWSGGARPHWVITHDYADGGTYPSPTHWKPLPAPPQK